MKGNCMRNPDGKSDSLQKHLPGKSVSDDSEYDTEKDEKSV